VPIPKRVRMNNPRLNPPTCTSTRFRMFVWPRRCVRRSPPVS
jgi:hypothetical protein